MIKGEEVTESRFYYSFGAAISVLFRRWVQAGAMFGWLFACLRLLRRLVWWSFLITLPFHLIPFLNGLIEGVFLSNLVTETYFASLANFASNVENARSMDWFSVPGAPGIHDVAMAPFHVVQLWDPQSWWEKLGLWRFDVDVTDDAAMDAIPIDSFASLEVLYRKAPRHGQTQLWHHFVYASPGIIHIEGLWFDEWDSAFNELLQYHYANPPPTGAKFHYLSCPGSFLGDIWSTRGPALLHFTTESPELFDDFDEPEEREQIPGYLPVTVRIIEFPLTDREKLGLPPGQFPSPFNQLRSVTSHRHMWQVYRPFSKVAQFMERLDDRCNEAEKTYAQTYGRLFRLETWIRNKLGLEDSLWPAVARVPAIAISSAATQALRGVWGLVNALSTHLRRRYWGKNKAEEILEWMESRTEENQEDEKYQADNMMAYALKAFTESLPIDLNAIAKDNPVVQGALDNMRELVQRKPVPAGDGEEEDARQGRPVRGLWKTSFHEAALALEEDNAEELEEMRKSNLGDSEVIDKIWDMVQRKKAKDGKKKE